jgi:hypothetical protein
LTKAGMRRDSLSSPARSRNDCGMSARFDRLEVDDQLMLGWKLHRRIAASELASNTSRISTAASARAGLWIARVGSKVDPQIAAFGWGRLAELSISAFGTMGASLASIPRQPGSP